MRCVAVNFAVGWEKRHLVAVQPAGVHECMQMGLATAGAELVPPSPVVSAVDRFVFLAAGVGAAVVLASRDFDFISWARVCSSSSLAR